MKLTQLAVGCVVAALTSGTAGAQSPAALAHQPEERIEVTLTLAGHDGPPLILRRAGDTPRDVVLVNPSRTDARQLTVAIHALLVLQAADPEGLRRNDRLAASPTFTTPIPPYPWADAMLRRLRDAAQRSNTGTASPWSETISMPVPRLRPRQP